MFKKLIIRIKIFLGKYRRYGMRSLRDGTFSLRTGKHKNKLARWKVFYGISYEENNDKHYGEYETFGWNFYQTSNCERPSFAVFRSDDTVHIPTESAQGSLFSARSPTRVTSSCW